MNAVDRDAALEPKECLRLLRTVSLGRVVFTESALPAVRPVTFVAPDGEVIIPAGGASWGPKLDGTVVAFEVEDIDQATREGWSVVVVGRARLVTDPASLQGFPPAGERPWAPAAERLLLTIDIEHLSGRRMALVRPLGTGGRLAPVVVAETDIG
ncbi:pyridoxamine 5'-phosphate oxidase family protein [Amycolatopsis rhizosphaerae]|uniref:Pyridoxamine 5'-phosphate oxidase family protein n=1 Tax=Amycolatopsis rhizosphaerae TaxID=2053003 RepID=A0A558A235_9PSEU|nr:pyridoxamine 5'-phosphate oxidase family protein [Amycolatopsis rhizosphaerae]TVT18324.1 pyridoxamine 5'-phosphate oxidase family protein [Amycolatopsis rhizosphaerae]